MKALEELQAQALEWAEHRDDIRVALLIGSRARRDHQADALSDLDLVLFTSDIAAYQVQLDWLAEIGDLWVSIAEPRSDGYPEYLALFEGGLKLDFNFFPISMLEELIHWNALRRGYHVLLDKDGLAKQMPASPFASPKRERPSAEMFLQTATHFWYNAYQVAKFIKRGELWVAYSRDHLLKEDLLRMVEWQAQAEHDWDYDTWHGGRFLSEWAEPGVYQALERTFARLETEDSWRALMASIKLFRRLATDIARRLGYTYPQALDAHVTEYIQSLTSESD